MTTSGTYGFSVSRDDIIRTAMMNIVQLGEGEDPTAQEIQDCARFLNLMVKQWMSTTDFAPGLKVWTRRHADLLLTSTQGAYNLGPSGDNWTTNLVQTTTGNFTIVGGNVVVLVGTSLLSNYPAGATIAVQTSQADLWITTVVSATPIFGGAFISVVVTGTAPVQVSVGNFVYSYTTKAQRPEKIETLYLRDSLWNDTPMRIITSEEYDFLPNKQQPGYVGDPMYGYYENQLINGVLYLDVAGAADTTKRVRSTFLEPVQDFNNPLDTPEYPAPYYLALVWGLTKQIAPMFEEPFTKDMQDNFDSALAMAREGDPTNVTALYFLPGNE